ncbi:MAG TPA: hypothetical protein VFI11_08145 [Anaerolineales bacterium]|nr:hypothetical protein [Anaerolineales bacterium]
MTDVPEFDTLSLRRERRQALGLWVAWLVFAVIVNQTIPFLLRADVRAWTYSPAKSALVDVVAYGVLFFFGPLVTVKGWAALRKPGFAVPVLMALVALACRAWFQPAAIAVVVVLIYLHIRYDLSTLGFRSRGLVGDGLAVLALVLLVAIPSLIQPGRQGGLTEAAEAGLDRLFLNPASSLENLFYFAFLAERLATFRRPLTPVLIGAMYTLHEVTNPEYWYEGVPFALVFVGVSLACAVYLWRRSLPVVWLGDGLGRFLARLL